MNLSDEDNRFRVLSMHCPCLIVLCFGLMPAFNIVTSPLGRWGFRRGNRPQNDEDADKAMQIATSVYPHVRSTAPGTSR